jgi:TPR repeat protein
LIKRYAEKGFAPAQYEYGMTFCNIMYSPEQSSEEGKRDYYKWIELSAKQDYPEALSMLSIIHSFGKNRDIEKAKKLSLKAAKLGEFDTCIALAKREEMEGNYDLALHWCDMAKTQDVDMIKEIENVRKRIMRKKNDEDKH